MEDENEDIADDDPVRKARDSVERVSDMLIVKPNDMDKEEDQWAGMHEIRIKLREKARGENTDTLIQGRSTTGQSHGSRREKERIIGEVVIKVSEWRRLYTEQGVTLENAAQRIGISKKSLDDYFLQLR